MRPVEAAATSQRICELLAGIEFIGLPLAPAIEASIFSRLSYSDGSLKGGIPQRLSRQPALRLCLEAARGISLNRGAIGRHRVIIDAMSVERTQALCLPLAARLGDCSLTLVDRRSRTRAANAPRTLPYSCIPPSRLAWFMELRGRLPLWSGAIKAAAQLTPQPVLFEEFLAAQLISACLAAERVANLFEAAVPDMVVVISDHHCYGYLLCAFARRAGKPSVTLQHGLLDRATTYLTVPLRADHYFAWGEYDAAIVRDSGVPSERIHLVGCGRLSPAPEGISAERVSLLRQEVHASGDQKIACLAVNHGMPEDDLRLMIDVFSAAISERPRWKGIVRPHPAQDMNQLRFHLRRHPNLTLVHGSRASITETAAMCEAVVTHQTGLAMDVLLSGATIIGLDILPSSMGYVEDLSRLYKAAYWADSTQTLRKALDSIAARDEDYLSMHSRYQQVVPHFFSAFGEESHDRAAAAVRTLLA